MTMPWLKLWNEILDKEKIQRLDSCSFKAWINLLCCAARHNMRGTLQPSESLAFLMRMSVKEVESHIAKLVGAGLIDRVRTGYAIHDWDHWQPCAKTDAERKADERRRKKESRDSSRDLSRDKADDERDKSRDESRECHASRGRGDSDSDSDKKEEEKNVVRPYVPVAPPASVRRPKFQSSSELRATADRDAIARVEAEEERMRRANGRP